MSQEDTAGKNNPLFATGAKYDIPTEDVANKSELEQNSAIVKQRITIMIDQDILNHFKEQAMRIPNGKYQSLINAALLASIENEKATDTKEIAVMSTEPTDVQEIKDAIESISLRLDNLAEFALKE